MIIAHYTSAIVVNVSESNFADFGKFVHCTMYNISDFQMVENNMIHNAKLLRDEIPKWEVISKYEDVVLQSQGGQWGFQYY